METISVNASRRYDVHIGPGLLAQAGNFISRIADPCTVAVISDSHVAHLYRKTVTDSLKAAGFNVIFYEFMAGETHKNIDTYDNILTIISQAHLTRSDLLVALGGGVTGDLTGFAAATYLRGVPYIQLPTTLLAAVDSSVGGKTAINLTCGKNLAGTVYQPSMVLCDTDCLKTLPGRIFCDGFAEVVKYAMIGGGELLSLLKNVVDPLALLSARGGDGSSAVLTEIIAACVRSKTALVEADEFDRGPRRLLNFGHTFGHAIEAAGDYTISHGKAVAAGMAIMTRAAVQKGLCPAAVLEALLSLLLKFKLPSSIGDLAEYVDISHMTAADLSERARSDKKNSGGKVHMVVPAGLGTCTVLPVLQNELTEWLRAGGVQ